MDKMTGKKKRNYQRWNNSEKYTLMVAMSILGIKETHRIADLLEDRTENQVGSWSSNLSSYMSIISSFLKTVFSGSKFYRKEF